MRSIIDIPDLSLPELDALMDTAEDIISRPGIMRKFAGIKNWPPCSLSPAPAPA